MSEALEITTFRLVSGLTGTAFVKANEDINVYLRRQPGFRWRRITEDDEGRITDIVAWDSATDGERSAKGIAAEMADSPVHATIDQDTVEFHIAPVLQHVT